MDEQTQSGERCRLTNRGEAAAIDAPTPTAERLADGQHSDHWVLCETERAKGFVRPVRDRYEHVGIPGPRFPLEDLTPEQAEHYFDEGYVKFESYPESEWPAMGRYWTQAQLDAVGKGCGMVTTMPRAIAETYARNPHFYGSTFCCGCGTYIRVGQNGEFVWLDGSRVGT